MKVDKILKDVSHSLLLQHSFEPLLIVDSELIIVSCNDELINTFCPKNKIKDLIKKKISILQFPNLIKLLAAFLNNPEENKIDSTLSMGVDDQNRIFDIKLSKVYDDDDNVAVILIYLREITFEVMREQKIWQSNEELSILYEISKVEVQSIKYEEILNNVLQKFSELTNLSRGFFVRKVNNIKEQGDFISYNLKEKEKNYIIPTVTKNKIPDIFFKENSHVLDIKSEKHTFFKSVGKMGVNKIITIPVLLKGDIFGALIFFSELGDILRMSSDKRFYNLIGQQVGLALEKAKLFNELEHSFCEIEKKNKQLNDELALAQKMQKGILSLKFPKKSGVDFAVKYIPSYHLSGDFYDIFEISKDKIGVLIADVCGHGINAALVTSFLKASVRDISQDYYRPDYMLDNLNKKLWELLNSQMFVSAFYLIIDLKKRELLFSNAGHPYPVFYNETEKTVSNLVVDGTLLSVMKDSEYSVGRIKMNSGDRVILYTDGILDMKNKKGEFLPIDFIDKMAVKHSNAGAHEFIDILINKVYKFANMKHFDDDINLIIVDFD